MNQKRNLVINSFQVLLIIFTILTIRLPVSAQEKKEFETLRDDIQKLLPPLEALIDSAMLHNPMVRYKDLDIDVNRYKLKLDRALWIKDFGIQGTGQYGTFDNFSTNSAEGQSPSLMAIRSNQLNYQGGLFLKLPIYDMLSRKSQIKMDKVVIEQAQNFSRYQRNDLRQTIIKQYNDLIVKNKILKIKAKYAETCKISMQMVEKDFLNGVISITEYTRISGIFSMAEADLESAKMDFRTSYMILEEMVGIKFHVLND